MIISFYSYKGGVGRSQLCANIAAYLFYQKDKKVLIWDWDFEAPGQHYFFGFKNEDISKPGTIELLTAYANKMRTGKEVKLGDIEFPEKEKNIISLVSGKEADKKSGCIDLLAAGMYDAGFSGRANDFNWYEFYSMLDGVTYIEELRKRFNKSEYDYVLIDGRTGISDYSGICNIQLPDINVMIVAPTMQNFEGSRSIIDKILNHPYKKAQNVVPYMLPILSRLDYSSPRYNEWVKRFEEYFSKTIRNLDNEYDLDFQNEVFSDVYFPDTFIPYTPAISAGENILFDYNKTHSRTEFSRPFIKIAEYIENISNDGSVNFYSRIPEEIWKEYAAKSKESRKIAIAYTQIGIKQNESDKKIEFCNKAIEIDPTYPPPFFYAGNSYYVKGIREKAIECFSQYLLMVPSDPVGWNNLGNIYSDKNEFDRAIESFKKAIDLRSNYSDPLFGLAIVYENKKDFLKAKECYETILNINPEDYASWNNLAVVTNNLGVRGKAMEYYNKAVEINPDFALGWSNLGLEYGKYGEYEKAINSVKKAVEINPNDCYLWNSLGLIYMIAGNNDKAIEGFRSAIERKKDYAVAWDNLGTVYLKKEGYKNAIECFEKAIAADENFVDAWSDMGAAYGQKGEKEKAIDFHNKAINIDKENPLGWNSLGFTLISFGDLEEAEKNLKQAIELGSNDSGNLNMGHLYLIKKEEKMAIEYYLRGANNYFAMDHFWKEMEEDFRVLNLPSRGITKEMFEKIKSEIKSRRYSTPVSA